MTEVNSIRWWMAQHISLKSAAVAARLADALCHEAGAEPSCQAAQLRKGQRMKLVQLLADYRLPITGHEGYGKVSCRCLRTPATL